MESSRPQQRSSPLPILLSPRCRFRPTSMDKSFTDPCLLWHRDHRGRGRSRLRRDSDISFKDATPSSLGQPPSIPCLNAPTTKHRIHSSRSAPSAMVRFKHFLYVGVANERSNTRRLLDLTEGVIVGSPDSLCSYLSPSSPFVSDIRSPYLFRSLHLSTTHC